MPMKKMFGAALGGCALIALAAGGASAQFMTSTESTPGASTVAPAAGGAAKAMPAKKAAKKSAKESAAKKS